MQPQIIIITCCLIVLAIPMIILFVFMFKDYIENKRIDEAVEKQNFHNTPTQRIKK